MVKAILGYDIVQGMSEEAYEKWLREVHLPDLSRVPGLKRVVLNTVKGTVRGDTTFYRIAELHYETMEAFEKAMEWRKNNPVSKERSPEGKTDFKFYVVCESEEFDFSKRT
ncbi:MAG: EthD family reductase [Deltaproteobacteria bacterium]|nr:EthD family reductase [Deltaproteobacteria bacterium]